MSNDNTILDIIDLKKYFPSGKGTVQAVDGISFSINKGKTLGVVGESGCGKTTTGRAILRLTEPDEGKVIFDGKDILKLNNQEMKSLRKDMQIIFQDPFSSLDPRKTVNHAISEPIKLHKMFTNRKEMDEYVKHLLETVGLSARFANSYPHELDGGRRQRIGIARAIGLRPKFIVCDEPVSALDVSIQAQILNLLKELQGELGLTYMFITHNLSVVHHFADDIAVMYMGKVVEKASSEELFHNPVHPYTKALLSAVPVPEISNKRERILLKGEITSPIDLPDNCRFSPRCNYCEKRCLEESPELIEISPNHFVSCHLFGK